MNNKFKILLIEDESNIRSLVVTLLETNGYKVIPAANCNEAKMMFDSYLPDLVILDLGLPDGDGIQIISYVRERFNTPVIVLSARTDESDKVGALDLGANDYVTKPFGTAELLARVRAALRNNRYKTDDSAFHGTKFVCSDLVIDYDSRRVFIDETEIKLTQTEYNILALLSEYCGKLLTYSAIIKNIWGESANAGSIKKLQVNMANIRKKLSMNFGEQKYILNELGVGYRMNGDL